MKGFGAGSPVQKVRFVVAKRFHLAFSSWGSLFTYKAGLSAKMVFS